MAFESSIIATSLSSNYLISYKALYVSSEAGLSADIEVVLFHSLLCPLLSELNFKQIFSLYD